MRSSVARATPCVSLLTALVACGNPNGAHTDARAGDGSRLDATASDSPITDSPVAIDASTIDSACGVCPANAPICDGTTCRGCIADAECAAGACNEAQGICVPDADVLYVATTGSDGGNCTRAEPCATVSYASSLLAAPFTMIALGSGTYGDSVAFIDQPVLLSGPDRGQDAVVAYVDSGSAHSILQFFDGSASYVEGIAIAGGDGSSAAVTVNSTTVTFDRVAIANNAHVGLDVASSGSAVVTGSTLSLNKDQAIFAQGGLDVERSFFHDNGLGVLAGTSTIRNSMFANNTQHIEAISGTMTADFDTFATATGTAISSIATIAVTDSLVSQASNVSSGAVTFAFTMFTGTAAAGSGNFTGSADFVDPANEDFHIMAGSPAIDQADPASTVTVDFDGEVRPHGLRSDCGADEQY